MGHFLPSLQERIARPDARDYLYNPACDLTADNKINVFDLQILGRDWNK